MKSRIDSNAAYLMPSLSDMFRMIEEKAAEVALSDRQNTEVQLADSDAIATSSPARDAAWGYRVSVDRRLYQQDQFPPDLPFA